MLTDIIDFLQSAKRCVDTIIKELEELKDLKEHKMKKINLFIEIIHELGTSIVNLENAYEYSIPLEHKLKYLIIKELKFDLEDFSDSIKEYKIWYRTIKHFTEPTFTWLCCKPTLTYVVDPSELTHIIQSNTTNIIDASIKLSNILPSTMNKRLDDSFHKIMEKLMIVIELEKYIFGTAINIKHPILRRAWMNLGPSDKLQNEVEQYKLEESLLVMLKEENHGIIVNEKKCRDLISNFLEDLEKKAGNKPNGRISIDELNECIINESNTYNVLALLDLKTQPGCNLDTFEDEPYLQQVNITPEDVLQLLATFVSKHLTNNSTIKSSNITPNNEVDLEVTIDDTSSSISLEDIDIKTPFKKTLMEKLVTKKPVTENIITEEKIMEKLVTENQELNNTYNEIKLIDSLIIEPNNSLTIEPNNSLTIEPNNSLTIEPNNSLTIEPNNSLIIEPNIIEEKLTRSPTRSSLKTKIRRFSQQKQLSEYTILRLFKFDNIIFVNQTDNSGLLCCDGYGSNWPYKLAFEYDTPELPNTKTFGGLIMKCECIDQGWGGTGHVNIRYQVGTNKIIPAFFIDRNKNPSSIYTYLIKPDELDSYTHIKVWLCCPPWSGWSATLKSTTIDIKLNS